MTRLSAPLWNNMMSASLCSTQVELDDLLLFLPEQQARDAMDAFDGDADGHISAEVAMLTILPSKAAPLTRPPVWPEATHVMCMMQGAPW